MCFASVVSWCYGHRKHAGFTGRIHSIIPWLNPDRENKLKIPDTPEHKGAALWATRAKQGLIPKRGRFLVYTVANNNKKTIQPRLKTTHEGNMNETVLTQTTAPPPPPLLLSPRTDGHSCASGLIRRLT